VAVVISTAVLYNREMDTDTLTDERLTQIYNTANNIADGKRPPITTQRIFAAMRLVEKLTLQRVAALKETK
jgi:hypothetical protein